IRDATVTGVQTCALPIFTSAPFFWSGSSSGESRKESLMAEKSKIYPRMRRPSANATTARLDLSGVCEGVATSLPSFSVAKDLARSEERRVGNEEAEQWRE